MNKKSSNTNGLNVFNKIGILISLSFIIYSFIYLWNQYFKTNPNESYFVIAIILFMIIFLICVPPATISIFSFVFNKRVLGKISSIMCFLWSAFYFYLFINSPFSIFVVITIAVYILLGIMNLMIVKKK